MVVVKVKFLFKVLLEVILFLLIKNLIFFGRFWIIFINNFDIVILNFKCICIFLKVNFLWFV